MKALKILSKFGKDIVGRKLVGHVLSIDEKGLLKRDKYTWPMSEVEALEMVPGSKAILGGKVKVVYLLTLANKKGSFWLDNDFKMK